jgi:hypothetical protein
MFKAIERLNQKQLLESVDRRQHFVGYTTGRVRHVSLLGNGKPLLSARELSPELRQRSIPPRIGTQ